MIFFITFNRHNMSIHFGYRPIRSLLLLLLLLCAVIM